MAAKDVAKAAVKKADVIASNEEQLAHHLNRAEDHLIEAVKLFERRHPPKRTLAFIDKITRAQEMVTSLYREELVRIRGPINMTVTLSGKRSK